MRDASRYSIEELKSVFTRDVCHNPVKYLACNCEECQFTDHCIAECKFDYKGGRKPKRKQAEAEEETPSVMLAPVEIKAPKKVSTVPKKETRKEEKPQVKVATKVQAPKKVLPKKVSAPKKNMASFLIELDDED